MHHHEGRICCSNAGFLFTCADFYQIRLDCHFQEKIAWGAVHLNSDTLNELARLVDNGQLQPVVDKIFSPRDVELAFQHTDSAQAIGKTVIRFRYCIHVFILLSLYLLLSLWTDLFDGHQNNQLVVFHYMCSQFSHTGPETLVVAWYELFLPFLYSCFQCFCVIAAPDSDDMDFGAESVGLPTDLPQPHSIDVVHSCFPSM